MANDYPFPKAVDFDNLSARAKKNFDPTGWVLQPKWDGCALVVTVDSMGNYTTTTASNKPVYSCDHLAEGVSYWCGPGVYVIEVWSPSTAFQAISGMFRTHNPQRPLVGKLFDGYRHGKADSPYSVRMSDISKVLCSTAVNSAYPMGIPFSSFDRAWEEAKWWQAQGGYDGCILRNPNAPWVPGRSKGDIVKLKPLTDWDLQVTGIKADVGEKTGRPTVALECAWKAGKKQFVSTGLTHEEQANAARFIGSIVTVRGMGLTADGFIREPRYITVRDDKLEADY